MQSSPSKEATQDSSNHTKGTKKPLQSTPQDADNDSGGGIISQGGRGGNDGYGDPDVNSSTQMEQVTSDVETKVRNMEYLFIYLFIYFLFFIYFFFIFSQAYWIELL